MSGLKFIAIYASIVLGAFVLLVLLRTDAADGFHILGSALRAAQ